ncbi:alpha/beta-hydrolase [Ramicandelaber brevisporus]|nr:alpha/beta-hydrolase [Ramicandelaber brevisporus]
MGSSLEIWSRQIAYLRQLCEHDGRRYAVNMLLLDWIGHGQSECPDEPDAYNHDAVVDTVVQVIDDARREHAFEELHFVSHSYGTAIVTRLIPILYERIQFNTQKSTPTPASPQPSSDMHFGNDDHDDERAPLIAASSSPSPSALKFSYEIKSCIFLGAAPLDNKRSISRQHRFIISAPAPIFSLFRQFDRFGGRNSASVKRYLHANAVIELKQQQLEWNRSVQTWVFQRVFRGVQFASRQEMQRLGEIGVEIGTKLAVAAGDKDQVSRPPIEIARTIASILQIQPREKNGENYIVMNGAGHQLMIERPDLTNELLLRTIFH